MARNYYIVLGISRGANTNQIKQAYRRIAKKYHPDMSPSEADRQKFIEVKAAYDTLIDEEKRKRHDEDLIRQGSSLRVTRVPERIRKRSAVFDEMDHLSSRVDEFFEGFLPGFFQSGGPRPLEKDIYLEVILSPVEARDGGLFPITVPVIEACPRCSRSGVVDSFFCPDCMGYGRIRSERQFSLSIPPNTKDHTSISLSMEDIGLSGVDLHVLVLVDPDM